MAAQAFTSVSTWSQPTPPPASAERSRLLDRLARRVAGVRPGRVRVVVDGLTGSGKTSLAHELAAAVRALGRPTLRASLDDFKRPWRDAVERGYDRTSGEGYYRNAQDVAAARGLLLAPAGPDGSGVVALCAHDPITGADHRAVTVAAPADAVLVVDGAFGMRPEYDAFWDLRVWLATQPEVALARALGRDVPRDGRAEAERLHRERYAVSERIYVGEVDPVARADVVVDNTDLAAPVVLRW